ncbi:hypothetical protein C8Q69DRAFT_74727 [Paecilomyces variotii]|uniref:Sld7 C-terminal domain-containing protein n=1 Tax=Byssochlamys spectabilis TaxID=264951 RepID=A0A443HM58_BYSSP|nr:hypothetical protein C8Q69DRAFT_74727 [Paecilomyces variotii]KAJ9364720.1 hypothetical protein DTO280E4_1500 [Paecilomyces variotii]KAJ9392888.1 hypothetical protein DTO063F5_25 [Paecilomyces variotii]RWQ92895.1 hypothetical protein C8Q69DRAFT_74727 [Paecilomyces variotii]
MEVWSGDIACNAESSLKGIRLLSSISDTYYDIIPKDAKLSVRSLVNPALIPLYARAGPSLELHATNVDSSQWLKSKLLSNIWLEEDAIEKGQSIQCPIGILLQVQSSRRGTTVGHPISDILVYGILSNRAPLGRPPTPPVSSSPDVQEEEDGSGLVKRELRVYASPLSGSLISKAQALPSPPSSPENRSLGSNGHFAEFIPDLRSPSPKRKRVATLFEVAAQHHKRVRQKGGEAVSQLMAHANSQSIPPLNPIKIKKEPDEIGNYALERISSQRARSLSLGGSLRASRPADNRLESQRPSTAKSHGRNTISRANTPNPFHDSSSLRIEKSEVPSSQSNSDPLSGPKDVATIISENKTLMTRTILTCMRLYGYHRSNSRSSTNKNHAATQADLDSFNAEERDTRTPAPENGPSTNSAGGSDEDEFRSMYHATYKAATFALRRYLREGDPTTVESGTLPPILEKEKATNTIDGLLRLFCEDA